MQTAKQQAANQRRSLQAVRNKLMNMSCAWSGVDGYFETRLEDLVDGVNKLDGEMAEFIANGGNDDNS